MRRYETKCEGRKKAESRKEGGNKQKAERSGYRGRCRNEWEEGVGKETVQGEEYGDEKGKLELSREGENEGKRKRRRIGREQEKKRASVEEGKGKKNKKKRRKE
jgi:hypothetical protein